MNEQMDWEAGANAMVALTRNTSLSADFISSTKSAVATDVAVELTDDRAALVESLAMSLKWGMFDISGGDAAEGAAMTENDQSDLFVQGKLDYGYRGAGRHADAGHHGHREPA